MRMLGRRRFVGCAQHRGSEAPPSRSRSETVPSFCQPGPPRCWAQAHLFGIASGTGRLRLARRTLRMAIFFEDNF